MEVDQVQQPVGGEVQSMVIGGKSYSYVSCSCCVYVY